MKNVFSIALLFLPGLLFSQPNHGVNAELKLRSDLIFGKNVNIEGDNIQFLDGYLLTASITGHEMFDSMSVIHDDQNQLTEYSYSCKSKDKTEKNKAKILSSLEKYFGQMSKRDSDEYGITWDFKKGDDFASFNILGGQCTLTLSTNSLIRAKEEFDTRRKINIITVSGLVANYHEDNAMGGAPSEYLLHFEGLKEKKIIVMRFNPTYKDCKSFRFLLNDSVMTSLAFNRRQYIGNKEYNNELELPRELADKLYCSSKVIIQTTGKFADQIRIPDRISKIYRVIYEYLYK